MFEKKKFEHDVIDNNNGFIKRNNIDWLVVSVSFFVLKQPPPFLLRIKPKLVRHLRKSFEH